MLQIRRLKYERFDHIIDPTDWIFGCLNKEVLDKLRLVSIGDYLPSKDDRKTDTLTNSIHSGGMRDSFLLDMLLNKYDLCSRNPQVYLKEQIRYGNYDLSKLLSKHIKELCLRTRGQSTLMTSGEISLCLIFTSLTLRGFEIDPSVPSALTKAVNDGKLPNIRRIELRELNKNDVNWPEVPEFSYQTYFVPTRPK